MLAGHRFAPSHRLSTCMDLVRHGLQSPPGASVDLAVRRPAPAPTTSLFLPPTLLTFDDAVEAFFSRHDASTRCMCRSRSLIVDDAIV